MLGLFRRREKRCPICGSTNIRRSTRSGFLETGLLPFINAYPYRCRDCNNRFFLHTRRAKNAVTTTERHSSRVKPRFKG